jgi:hypothetical protein
MPLPSDPKVIFLGGLFVLALLAAAYVASEIVLPLVFAIILKLLLQPALRMLERLHVPRMLAAPRFSSKRQVVEISQQIESDISAYLVTIRGDPIPLGDGGLSAELCANPRHCFGRVDLSSRRPVDHRHALASAASCGALPWISFDRG